MAPTRQNDMIAFFRDENRVLKARFLDDLKRRRLAELGRRFGRQGRRRPRMLLANDTAARRELPNQKLHWPAGVDQERCRVLGVSIVGVVEGANQYVFDRKLQSWPVASVHRKRLGLR
jgi:hypothetical protein